MYKRLRHPFGVTRKGIPITEYQLPKIIDPEIAVATEYGFVSELEEREAAVYVLYTWSDWQQLDWRDRAAAIAQHRLKNLIDSHVAHAEYMAGKQHAAVSVPTNR
jgi:hypothetical protein